MTEGIVDASPEQLVAVIEQMADLPWPDGDEWLEWEIDGLEGQTSFLMHVLPLAATSDATALTSFTSRSDRCLRSGPGLFSSASCSQG